MKILVICGSPRKGNNEKIVKEIIQKAKDMHSVDSVFLAEIKLKYCTGCLRCEDEGVCPLDDGFHDIKNKILASDIIVLSTPVYFDNLPGKVKTLIDRTNLFMSSLKGKKMVVFLSGQADAASWQNCSSIIENYCQICEIEYLGYYGLRARDKDDLNKQDIEKIAKKVLEMIDAK